MGNGKRGTRREGGATERENVRVNDGRQCMGEVVIGEVGPVREKI